MKNDNMVALDSLDKLQRLDHDTLVKLNANVESFISQYSSDIKELKDGTNSRITDVDSRLRVIERVHEKVDPIGSFTRLENIDSELKDFKRYWKVAQIIVITIAGIGGFFVKTLSDILSITHK